MHHHNPYYFQQYHHTPLQKRILTNITNILKTNTITPHHLSFPEYQSKDILVQQYKNMIPNFKMLIATKNMYFMFNNKNNNYIYLCEMFQGERKRIKDKGFQQWLKWIIDRINVYEEYLSFMSRLFKYIQHQAKSMFSYATYEKYNIFDKGTTQFLVQLMNNQYDLLQSKNHIFQLLSWPEINIQLSPADPLSINIRKILILISNLVKEIFELRRVNLQKNGKQDKNSQIYRLNEDNQRLKNHLKKIFNQNKALCQLLDWRDKKQASGFRKLIANKEEIQIKLQEFIGQLQRVKMSTSIIQQQQKVLKESLQHQLRHEKSSSSQKIQQLNTKIQQFQQQFHKQQQQNSNLSTYISTLEHQNSTLNIQLNSLMNKYLQLQQKHIKLQLQKKEIKSKYEELMIKYKDMFDSSIRQGKKNQQQVEVVDAYGKMSMSHFQLLECKLEELKVENSLLVYQLSQMREAKERVNQQFNQLILLRDDSNRQHLQAIEQFQTRYQIKLQQEKDKLTTNLHQNNNHKMTILQERHKISLSQLQNKLIQTQQQRQQYKQKYYIQLNKILKKSNLINQSKYSHKSLSPPPLQAQPKQQPSFNLINVIDDTIIELYQPEFISGDNYIEEYSNVIHLDEFQKEEVEEDDNSLVVKELESSIRKQMERSHQRIVQENQVLKGQITRLQQTLKELQQNDMNLKEKLSFFQQKDKQSSLLLIQKTKQITHLNQTLTQLTKTNKDYQSQLQAYLQAKLSNSKYNIPQLIHIQCLLFNGDIFKSTQSNHLKSTIIKHVQQYVNSSIIKTQLLYKYDVYNKANFHLYIDDKQYFLCLIKMKNTNTIIAGFYPGQINDRKLLTKGGLLISATKDQSYPLKVNRHNDKSVYKGMIYDKYYIIFGNAQLRIRAGQRKVFSNYGIGSGFYDYQNAMDRSVGYFLENGDEKQCQFEYCQCYQILFDRIIDIKSRSQHENNSIFTTF